MLLLGTIFYKTIYFLETISFWKSSPRNTSALGNSARNWPFERGVTETFIADAQQVVASAIPTLFRCIDQPWKRKIGKGMERPRVETSY
jgi:hypothetical protein